MTFHDMPLSDVNALTLHCNSKEHRIVYRHDYREPWRCRDCGRPELTLHGAVLSMGMCWPRLLRRLAFAVVLATTVAVMVVSL